MERRAPSVKDTPRDRDCDGATHSCRQLQRSLAMHEKSARYRRRWRTEASPTNAAWGSAATPLKVMIETELRTPGDSCNVLWPCQSSPQTTVANRAPQPPRLLRSAQLGHRSRSRLRRSCTLVASCNVLWQSTKTQKEKEKGPVQTTNDCRVMLGRDLLPVEKWEEKPCHASRERFGCESMPAACARMRRARL